MILLNGSTLSVLYDCFTRGVRKKRDDLVGTALLEALAEYFIYFAESDVHPRHFHRSRVEGPGRR